MERKDEFHEPMPKKVACIFSISPSPIILLLMIEIFRNLDTGYGVLVASLVDIIPLLVFGVVFYKIYQLLSSRRISYYPPLGSVIGIAWIIAFVISYLLFPDFSLDDTAYLSMGLLFLIGDTVAYSEIKHGTWS